MMRPTLNAETLYRRAERLYGVASRLHDRLRDLGYAAAPELRAWASRFRAAADAYQNDADRIVAREIAARTRHVSLRLIWPGGDWQDTSLEEFAEDNAYDTESVAAVRALAEGESVDIGGGAAPLVRVVRLRRVS